MTEKTVENLRKAKHGDKQAAEALIEENSGLIWSVARRFFGRGTEPQALRRICRSLGKGYLLRCQTGLGGNLRKLRLTAKALLKLGAHRPDALRLFFYAAADLDCAVITQKSSYLAGYLRHGVGRKLRAEALVKALYRL